MDKPVVLITGALSGIGRATAIAFAKNGATVVVSGRHDEAGKALAEELRSSRPGMRVLFISGYPEDAIAHHGVLEEDKAFLQKPCPAAVLLRTVREVLDAPRKVPAAAASSGTGPAAATS